MRRRGAVSAPLRSGSVFPVLRLKDCSRLRSRANLFAWYLSAFADYALVYGSLGAVIALLTWASYSALILPLGAELSAEWSRLRRALGA